MKGSEFMKMLVEVLCLVTNIRNKPRIIPVSHKGTHKAKVAQQNNLFLFKKKGGVNQNQAGKQWGRRLSWFYSNLGGNYAFLHLLGFSFSLSRSLVLKETSQRNQRTDRRDLLLQAIGAFVKTKVSLGGKG